MKENPYKITWKFCLVSSILLQLFGWIFMFGKFQEFGLGRSFAVFIILGNIIGLIFLYICSELAWGLSNSSEWIGSSEKSPKEKVE